MSDPIERLGAITSDLTTHFDTLSEGGSAWLADVASLDERVRGACEELVQEAQGLRAKLATLQSESDQHWNELATQRDRVVQELGDLRTAVSEGTETLNTAAGAAQRALREFHEWCAATQSDFDEAQPTLDTAFDELTDAARAADQLVGGAFGGLGETLESVRQAVASQQEALDEQVQTFAGLIDHTVGALDTEVREFVSGASDQTSQLVAELERLATSEVRATSAAVRQEIETALLHEIRPLINRAVDELRGAIQEIVRSMTDDTLVLKGGGDGVKQLRRELEEMHRQLEEAERSATEFIREAEQKIRDATTLGL